MCVTFSSLLNQIVFKGLIETSQERIIFYKPKSSFLPLLRVPDGITETNDPRKSGKNHKSLNIYIYSIL